MHKIIWVVCCAITLAAAAHAAEQTSLEEVVVLADRTVSGTKTDTPLVEVPQSISIVTSDQIADRGALEYQQVFRYTAGVDTERSGTDMRSDTFSARGFALKQYLDGLNRTPDTVYGSRLDVFMLERAEVLRGPSAVLYGAGSSGGLLNAMSKRPKFTPGGALGLQLGNFERRALQADATGPLGSHFAGRIVAVLQNAELLSPGQENDKFVAMPSVIWKPGDRTEVTLIGLYQKEDFGTQTYLPLTKTLLAGASDPAIPIDAFTGEPGFNRMKTDHAAATLLVSHRFSDLISFNSNSRYIDQNVDYAEIYGSPPFEDTARTLIHREYYILDADYWIYNSDNNIRFDFKTGPLTHLLLVGADWTRFEHARKEGFSCRGVTTGTCWAGGSPPPLDVYNPVYGQPFTYGITNAYETVSNQLGFYLQDQMRWNDRVSLVLGVRSDNADSKSTTGARGENDATTFKVGIIGEVGKGVSPFVNYAESFTPLFGGDFYGNPFKPQEARQYEGGLKWQASANSLVTASYFDIEESGFLNRDPNNIQNRIQSGAIGSKGFEIEGIFNFDNGLGITASYSHVNTEATEPTVNYPVGARIENLPDHLASVWVKKSFIASDDLTWRIAGGVRQMGDEVDFNHLVTRPPVTLADVMGGFGFRDWNFTLTVTNVTDKEFYNSCSGRVVPYGIDGTCASAQTRTIIGTLLKTF